MQLITAPQSLSVQHLSIFLAGSIEQDKAERWQDKVIHALSELELTILNPRRAAWDDSWKQSIENIQFKEQVDWELDALESADFILIYFDKNTKSPITLLELGLFANTNKQLLVCCPTGFWRKGNVDIVCNRYNIPTFETLEQMIEAIRSYF